MTAGTNRRGDDQAAKIVVGVDRCEPVPVYRALLPTADRLLRYLEVIDANRYYTNRGGLVEGLEDRLRGLIAAPACAVITASSGTAALQAAILATAGRATDARPYAVVPGYTFVATAMAAEACGYRPLFVDIEAGCWALEPARLRAAGLLDRVGVVLAVAPYGRAHDQAGWAAFVRDTGVKVVIDAAASFERLIADPARLTGEVPVVVSFQATKAFSTGEGGAVIWSNIDGILKTVQALNFGFLYSRDSRSSGINGKMSEYHAAVGLAGLDEWAARAAANRAINDAYRHAAGAAGFGERLICGPTIASNYALYRARSEADAARVVTALTIAGVEHRYWYGRGVHREPYFRRDDVVLPETDMLAESLIGVPIYPGIEIATIARVVDAIATMETVRD